MLDFLEIKRTLVLYFLKNKRHCLSTALMLSHPFLGHFSLRERVVEGSLKRSMSLNPCLLTNSFGMQNPLFTGLLKKQLNMMFFGLMPGVNSCVARVSSPCSPTGSKRRTYRPMFGQVEKGPLAAVSP